MNFLAHSVLTPETDHWLLGNLVADLIKKKEYYLLPDDIQQGVRLHYKIDEYTDQHTLVYQGTKLLHETQGKYSPVATDLIWDLCLAEQWDSLTNLHMDEHINRVYAHLLMSSQYFETKLEGKVKYLVDKDFLRHYTTIDKMQGICEKIHARTKFASNLDKLMDDYVNHRQEFNDIFSQYFPQLSNEIPKWQESIS